MNQFLPSIDTTASRAGLQEMTFIDLHEPIAPFVAAQPFNQPLE